jgi:hypothetical protein
MHNFLVTLLVKVPSHHVVPAEQIWGFLISFGNDQIFSIEYHCLFKKEGMAYE